LKKGVVVGVVSSWFVGLAVKELKRMDNHNDTTTRRHDEGAAWKREDVCKTRGTSYSRLAFFICV